MGWFGPSGSCNCCCGECTDLFAENWAARLCLQSATMVNRSISGPPVLDPQAANDAYVAAVNTYFNTCSISSWTDVLFTYTAVSPNLSYKTRYASFTYPDAFTVYSQVANGSTWDTFTLSNTTFVYGALWQTTRTNVFDQTSPCTPNWFWVVYALVNAGSYSPHYTTLVKYKSGFGIVWPTSPQSPSFQSGQFIPDPQHAVGPIACASVGANPGQDLRLAPQTIQGTSLPVDNIVVDSYAYANHSTGAVSLTACA